MINTKEPSSEEIALLKRHKAAAMRDRLVADLYLTVDEVARRWNVDRSVVEAIPPEILPYLDVTPLSKRTRRRYHPADVIAGEVHVRRYAEAKASGGGEAYLRALRQEQERSEQAILGYAREMKAA